MVGQTVIGSIVLYSAVSGAPDNEIIICYGHTVIKKMPAYGIISEEGVGILADEVFHIRAQEEGVVTWTIPEVAAGEEGTVTLTVKVKKDAKGKTVYATIMQWPEERIVTIKSFATGAPTMAGAKVRSVKLLGYGKVPYSVDERGLHVALPETHPGGDIAPVLAMRVKGNEE